MTTQLKFYADTPKGETNKLFTFRISSRNGVNPALKRFMLKGWYIRAAWIQVWYKGGGMSNTRIYLDGYNNINTKTVSLK